MSTLVKRAANRISANSPHILTGLGVVGIAGTTYLVIDATKSSMHDLENEPADLTFMQKVKLCWVNYLPAMIVGVATISIVIMSNVVSTKRSLAYAAAASLSERALRDFQAKTLEVVGENKEHQIRERVAKERMDRDYGEIVLNTKEDVLCFDTFSGRTFSSTVEKIRKAQNDVNAECINGMPVSQNVFYSKLGLESIRAGEILGWNSEHQMDLRLFALLQDSQPVVAIGYQNDPKLEYASPW